MKFTVNLMRGAAAVVAMALLASCGGGTQIESFVPQRVVALGDEASLINTDGTKYTVNGVVFDTATPPVGTVECSANQVWVQQLAYSFGFAFPGCATAGYNANGLMLATVGATSEGLASQVDIYLGGDVNNKDLVAVMAGVHDIIDALNAADPTAAAEQAGIRVGAQVVRITDRGAKVIVSTVPDVGLTPFAANLELTTPGSIARLSDLSARFNTRLRLKLQEVRDGGRAVGLVLADELVLAMTRFPASYGVTNLSEPACVATLPNCSGLSADLDPDAAATYGYDWLWADATRLGPNAQSRLGTLAINRARSNPF